MQVSQRIFLLSTFCVLAIAQDYEDYNVPQPAPIRLRPNNNARIDEPKPTPVAILKQINKHNEDGSYTYGYEGGDGSFKIETKLATGEVKGKYGYVDETGKVRVVEYGANKYGFQPSGEGITVAPPTLVDETIKEESEPEYENVPVPRPQKHRPAPVRPRPQPRPEPQYEEYTDDAEPTYYTPAPRPQPSPARNYAPAPQPQYAQAQPAPAPPRLQVTGAQRTTDVVYSALQRPTRPEPDYSQSQSFGDGPSNVRISRPVYAPAPETPAPSSARAQGFLAPASGGRPIFKGFDFGPAQEQRHTPQAIPVQQPQQPQQLQQTRYQPQPQPQPQGRSGGGSSSLLDQLARDYALPQSNSQPLHDISFGYY